MKPYLSLLTTCLVLLTLAIIYHQMDKANRTMEGRFGNNEMGLSEASLTLNDVTIYSRSKGETEWEAKAKSIALFHPIGGDIGQLQSARITNIDKGMLYDKDKSVMRFSAQSAEWNNANGMLTIRGDILLKGENSNTLQSNLCYWTRSDGYLRFPEGANASFQGNRFTAPALNYSPSVGILQCPLGATGVFQGIKLHADSLLWSLKKQMITCPAPVTGNKGDFHFTAMSFDLDIRRKVWKANVGTIQVRIDNNFPPRNEL